MGELGDLLEAMHGAPESFTTLRATIRNWSHTERQQAAHRRFNDDQAKRQSSGSSVASAQLMYAGGDGGEVPETTEWTTQLWVERPSRARSELHGEHGHLRVRNGTRSWVEMGEWGPVEQEVDEDDLADEHSELFAPLGLVAGLELELLGPTTVAGRACTNVRGTPRDTGPGHAAMFALGADEIELAVDDERGLVLRLEARFEGEPFSLFEVTEIAFEEELDPALFVYEPPPGVRIRRPEELHSEFVHGLTLEEAAARAPFVVFALATVPDGTELIVHFMPARERPPLEEQLSLHYVAPRQRRSFTLLQRAAEGAKDVFAAVHVRVVRDGTCIDLMSDDLGEDELRALADELTPARTEPPELST